METLEAVPYLSSNGELRLKIWCPYCRIWHVHGFQEGNKGAHCWKTDSPWYGKGYILKMSDEGRRDAETLREFYKKGRMPRFHATAEVKNGKVKVKKFQERNYENDYKSD